LEDYKVFRGGAWLEELDGVERRVFSVLSFLSRWDLDGITVTM
jgi:hypothetical protein